MIVVVLTSLVYSSLIASYRGLFKDPFWRYRTQSKRQVSSLPVLDPILRIRQSVAPCQAWLSSTIESTLRRAPRCGRPPVTYNHLASTPTRLTPVSTTVARAPIRRPPPPRSIRPGTACRRNLLCNGPCSIPLNALPRYLRKRVRTLCVWFWFFSKPTWRYTGLST